VRVWTDNFEHVERLYELPARIRHMSYTTNMIEGFYSALRKMRDKISKSGYYYSSSHAFVLRFWQLFPI
jgi:transposase-like protein